MLFHRQIKDADYDVERLNLATGAVEKLAQTPREESYAAMSPQGDLIAFSSDRDAAVGKGDIYLMTSAGRILRRLTKDPVNDAYASWSPDGRYIYYNAQHENGTQINRIDIHNRDCVRG